MWWLPLIQTGIGLGQSIYSGIKAGEERRKAEALQQKQMADNEAWYNNEYYTDYTKRADSQNLLKRLKETTDSNNKRAEMTAAITGATPESVQAQRDANNKVVTDTYANLAAMGAQHKDNVQQQYLARKDGYNRNMYNTLLGNAASNEQGMYNGLRQIGSGLTGALANYGTKPLTPKGGTLIQNDYTPNPKDYLNPNYGTGLA